VEHVNYFWKRDGLLDRDLNSSFFIVSFLGGGCVYGKRKGDGAILGDIRRIHKYAVWLALLSFLIHMALAIISNNLALWF